MSGVLGVLPDARLTAVRQRRTTAGAAVYFELRSIATGEPIDGATGLAARYWPPGATYDDASAFPLTPLPIGAGVWLVVVPTPPGGASTVQMSVEAPVVQTAEAVVDPAELDPVANMGARQIDTTREAAAITAGDVAAALVAQEVARLSQTVEESVLPVATLALLNTVVGTREGQRAEVYADPPAPDPDPGNNGIYRWSVADTAWLFNGPSSRTLDARTQQQQQALDAAQQDLAVQASTVEQLGQQAEAIEGNILTLDTRTQQQQQALAAQQATVAQQGQALNEQSVGLGTLQGMVMQIEDDTGMGIAFLDGPDRNIIGFLALDGLSASFGGITLRRLSGGAVQVEDVFGNPLLTRSAAGNISVAGLGLGFMESEDAYIQFLDGPDGNVLFALYRDGTSTIQTGAGSSDTLTDPQKAIVRTLANEQIIAKVIGPVDARRLANNGDSLGAHANDRGTTQFGWNQRGFLSHLLFHTERRLVCTPADNYAIAGSQSSAILARAKSIADGGYGYISQLGGSINDIIHDVAAETTFANWSAAMDIYLAGGARPICTPILPHSSTGWIADSGASEQSQRDKINWIANKQRLYARQHPGVIWVEAGRDIVDPATGNLYPWAAYDHSAPGGGTHTAPRAAFLVGRRMARAVLPYLPPATYLRPDPTDLRTAANPLGNLLTNPAFLGTSGTVSAPHAGVLPDGWSTGQATIGTITGGTVTWSLEPRADGLPGQRLVLTIAGLTGTNSQTQLFARQIIPLSSLRYAAGDVLEAVSGIEVAAGSVGITEAAMRLIETDGSTALIFGSLSAYGANPITDQAFSGPLLAQPAAVRPASGAGTPSLEFRLGVFVDAPVSGGASLVAKWDLPSLNKVA